MSRKKSGQQKKKVWGEKVRGREKERGTKSGLIKERRDTCLLRKRREEIHVSLKAPYLRGLCFQDNPVLFPLLTLLTVGLKTNF